MAILIKEDGTKEQVSPSNGTDFGLAQLYSLIEVVYLLSNDIMIVDEEGMLADKGVNEFASIIANRRIVGNVVICKGSELT